MDLNELIFAWKYSKPNRMCPMTPVNYTKSSFSWAWHSSVPACCLSKMLMIFIMKSLIFHEDPCIIAPKEAVNARAHVCKDFFQLATLWMCNTCNLEQVQFGKGAIWNIYAICNMCNLQHLIILISKIFF